MSEESKERHDGRGNPRSSGLTLLADVQMSEVAHKIRTGRRIFARLRRCSPLNVPTHPADLRLADKQFATVRCGKIIEFGP